MQQTCFPSQSLFSDLVDLNVCVTVGSILQNSSLPSFLPSVSVHNNTCEQKTAARLSLLCIIVSAIRMTNWQYRWGLISSYSLKGILCHNSFNKEISTLPHIEASYQGLISTLPHIKASLIFTFLLQMNTTAVVSSGGAPTPAGTSVFTKHNWIWEWGICGLMGGAFIT